MARFPGAAWRALRALAALAVALLLMGCNHWFYQPSKEPLVRAEQLDPVAITESFITEPTSNNRLHVWQLKADRQPPFATVLHFHGNSQNLTGHVLYSYWLTYYGFRVITFDYSGYGQSEGSPSREQSIRDGMAFLRRYLAEPSPVVVLGQSLGGAVAIAALGRMQGAAGGSGEGAAGGSGEGEGEGIAGRTDSLAGLVIDSSFSRYRQVARKMLGRHWLTWALQYPLALTVSTEDNPVDYAGRLSQPVRMFHSQDDPVVAYSEGQELFAALGSRDKTLHTLTGRHHTAAFHFGPRAHKRLLVEFLCELAAEGEACLRWLEEVNATCTAEQIGHCQIDLGPDDLDSEEGQDSTATKKD